ncbi:histidine kinase [uncultured Desulfobacter sp.]|uniref:HAMP domain-containing sensor histidine kinase n=1 Tax=uncultured Desulfobacter sp. TaxID=240139 RepID=UPI002AAB438C|nr:histidine kinase [uncultured Desulfobacter sp.]
MIKPGLRLKLTVLIECLIVALVLGTGIVTTYREKKTLENELHKRGYALAADLSRFTASSLLSRDLPALRRFVNHSMAQEYVLYVMIVDTEDQIVMHSDLKYVGKDISVYQLEPLARHIDLSAPVRIADALLGNVFLGYSYMAVENEIGTAVKQVLMIGAVATTLGGIMAYMLASFIVAPIKRIKDATKQLAEGTYPALLEIRSDDEIGALAKSFNDMARELSRHRTHLQNLVDERTRALRELALHIQLAKEEEAKRIAREIHDELGQTLTALKIDLHWLKGQLSGDAPAVQEKISIMLRLIGETIDSVRKISSQLRPVLLDDFGLSAAMEWQAKEFSDRTGISSHFFSHPENIVPRQDKAVALFRVFQEALTNIARHAGATQVKAGLWETSDTLVMEVHDNGIGITKSQIMDTRSFGVIGMHERVKRLGGELEIDGQREQGTTLSAWIPKGDT